MGDHDDLELTQQEVPQITPLQFLQGFTDAPDQETIDSWKSQAPGHRIRMWHSTDGKRVYLLRGISALELIQVQATLPAGLTPEKLPLAQQNAIASRCCVWTSDSFDHRLSELQLQAAGAGLGQTLQEIIFQLSDFTDPMTIERCSADL